MLQLLTDPHNYGGLRIDFALKTDTPSLGGIGILKRSVCVIDRPCACVHL